MVNPLSYKEPRYFIDLETISDVDLTKVGPSRYARDNSTHITILGLYDKKLDKHSTVFNPLFSSLKNNPDEWEHIKDALDDISAFRESYSAHNVGFEDAMLNSYLGLLVKQIDGDLHNVPGYIPDCGVYATCTKDLAKLRRYAFSRLEDLGEQLLDNKKDPVGTNLIKIICRFYPTLDAAKRAAKKVRELDIEPEIKQLTPTLYYIGGTHVDKVNAVYCIKDVKAQYELFEKLKYQEDDPDFGSYLPYVIAIEKLTRRSNSRGIFIDEELAHLVYTAGVEFQKHADERVGQEFDGLGANQHAKLGVYIKARIDALKEEHPDLRINAKGVDKKKAIPEYRLKLAGIDDALLKKLDILLECRAASYSAAGRAVRKAISSDTVGKNSVIRDELITAGAHTMRHASKGFQVHNLPRPAVGYEYEDVPKNKEKLKQLISEDKITWEHKDLITSLLRPIVIPKPGYKFFSADLAQIDFRCALWLAGEMDALKIIHEKDLYLDFAQKLFPEKTLTKSSPERRIGKEAMLSLIYSVGAKKLRATILEKTGINLSLAECGRIKVAFRQKYANVVKLWNKHTEGLQKAFKNRKYTVRLPSGRRLIYRDLRYVMCWIEDEETGLIKKVKKLKYSNGKNFVDTYGGKIMQNTAQGTATDVTNMKIAHCAKDNPDWHFVFGVHDQAIFEVPENVTLEECHEAWMKAGQEQIEKILPGILLNSDSELLDYFYK